MENYKVVYWAENQVESDVICGMLKDCGIPYRELKESVGKTLGLQFGLLGQIAIAVPESQEAQATALILDMEPPEEDEEA